MYYTKLQKPSTKNDRPLNLTWASYENQNLPNFPCQNEKPKQIFYFFNEEAHESNADSLHSPVIDIHKTK